MSGGTSISGGRAQRAAIDLILPLILGVTLLIPQAVRAELATDDEMATVCLNWLSCIVNVDGSWAGETHPTIRDVQDVMVDGRVLAKCYSISPQGHVVVPVLKELPPIKVSSQDCDVDVEESRGLPQLLREVLGRRAQSFIDNYGSLDARQPSEGETLFGRKHRRLWNEYLVDPPRFAAELRSGAWPDRDQVGPLLRTNWTQLDPYNNFCPIGHNGSRTAVGCMATAMTQIMKYHEWPPRGVGGHSYYWIGDVSCGGSTEGEWLHASFDDPYDWENIMNDCWNFTCNEEQEDALAELNYEIPVAMEMFFGVCGSVPGHDDIAGMMTEFFRYAPGIETEIRGDYTAEGWFAIIQEEINNGRPMHYGFIAGPYGGHAIVCDGWRDTGGEMQYHMNYGWGGSQTAWYAIDDLYWDYNPMENVMLRYIMPGTGFEFEVKPDGTGFYPTIQAAIDDVLDEDVVLLTDGVFIGTGNVDVDFHGRPVTVRSASGNPATCIIDCGGDREEHRAFNFVQSEGSLSIIEGITITNGYINAGGGAILCTNGSTPTIRNCVISANRAGDDGGAILCSGASPNLNECVFSFNEADGNGGTVMITDGAKPSILHCTFYANGAGENGGGAFWISGDSSPEIDNCIIVSGTGGGAVQCEAGIPNAVLECCDIYGNAGGDWEGCIADQLGVDGNISEDPLFCDAENGNFRLQDESPCGQDHNPACGQIGAFPLGCGLHVVTPYGTGDFPTIQSAIDAAVDGDVIELTDGTYTNDGNRDLDYGGRSITIRSQSGDAVSCVIDCEGTETEPHRAFNFTSGETAGSVLQGVTISNGYQPAYSGGAVWCENGSSPTFERCIFRNNYAGASGGAVYCTVGSDATFNLCTFYENTGDNGGAILAYDSDLTIVGCTFAYNTANDHGAGILCLSSSPMVENSIIAFSTSKEGIHCIGGDPILTCCDIYGNAGGDWVGRIADQAEVNGNICEDPMFCHPPTGNFGLITGSPCAPFSPPNEECDLVGAWPVECNVESVSDGPFAQGFIRLGSSTPNPFRHSTRITYALPAALANTPVRLCIFDPAGRLVRIVVESNQMPGIHAVAWDGTNHAGIRVTGGVYFYQLNVDGESLTKQMVLVR